MEKTDFISAAKIVIFMLYSTLTLIFFPFSAGETARLALFPLFFQILRPYCRRLFHHFGAGTLGVIQLRAGFGHGRAFGLLQSQQFGANHRAVAFPEFLRKLLHQRIVGGFALTILAVYGTFLQSRQQEHAAGGAARLPHPSDAAAKRGGHAQCLFLRETIHICKGSHDGLRTIIAALKQFNGFFPLCLSSSYLNLLIPTSWGNDPNVPHRSGYAPLSASDAPPRLPCNSRYASLCSSPAS